MLVFDTLQYSDKLQTAGVTAQQAKIQAEALKEVIENNLATKQDIADLKRDMKEMELRLTIRLGSLMAFAVGVVATLVKLL